MTFSVEPSMIGRRERFWLSILPIGWELKQENKMIAKIFPELVMIGAHMGGHRHEYAEGIQIAQVHPNIYLDTSIPLPWFHEGCKRAVYDIPEKLLFGTDCSYDISVEAALQWKYYFRAFYEDKTVGEKVLGLNAEKIIADSGWNPKRMPKK